MLERFLRGIAGCFIYKLVSNDVDVETMRG